VLSEPTDVGATLFACATALLDEVGQSGPFRLVGLAAYDLSATADSQPALLPASGNRERRLETAIDSLADRFGRGVVQRAGDLARDRGVGVGANLDFLHDAERDD
jgi:DNA polymerase-4